MLVIELSATQVMCTRLQTFSHAAFTQENVLQLSCRQPQPAAKRFKIHSVVDQRRGVYGIHVPTCTLRQKLTRSAFYA